MTGDLDVLAEVRRLSRRPLWTPLPEHARALGRDEVERLVPHRDPFLLVDAVLAADPSQGCVTMTRHIDPSDPVFRGHFPGAPVYPGVLLVEAMGQAGLVALGLQEHGDAPISEARPRDVRVTRVHHAVFLAPVGPDDRVTLSARVVDSDGLTALVLAQAARGDTICAVCVMEVYLA